MNFKNLRVSIIILTSFLALAFFMLGYSFWNDHKYNEPLNEFLEENEKVSSFEITEGENKDFYIEIELNYHPDLNTTLLEIEESIDSILENKDWEIILLSTENDTLQEAFYEIHFSLYEAREKGNYREMYDDVEKILDDYDLEHYQIHILDDGRLLIQMKNDSGFLVYKLNNGEPKDMNQGSA